MYIMKLKPCGKDYIWGGTKLKTNFNKDIALSPLAETWEFSLHKDGLTLVDNGEFKGKTLLEVFKENPNIFGEKIKNKPNFPILIKFLDAKNKLSVQVHPDDAFARVYENENGKSEMWYILEAEKGAKIVYGFEHNVTAEMINKSVIDGSIEKHLHFEPVKKGDVFYIPAGMVHGVGEGIVLAEIQESSNLTYRVYDYDRVDKNGKKRELHIEKALKVLNMSAYTGRINQNKILDFYPCVSIEKLCSCEHFCVLKYTIKGNFEFFVKNDEFNVLLCIDGNGKLVCANESLELEKGNCIFVPNGYEKISIFGEIELLKINC